LLAVAVTLPVSAQMNSDETQIRVLIGVYAKTIDLADTASAARIFSNAPEVSFIHPRGEDRGQQQIVTDVIQNLMGGTFSARKLTPKDIAVHVYGETAWSEFAWDFVATLRKDGSPFHSQGVETQIYRRENGQWRIVHVHYSGATVTGNLKGF
jgi:ketosteroid isomerase-like protein